jgi:CheY-like chemotaxis protein
MSRPTRILLSDGVAMFRDLGKIFLSRSGPVDLAASASQAFEIARERPPSVVIADMHLPDMDGPALCRAFKSDPAWGSRGSSCWPAPLPDRLRGGRAGGRRGLYKPSNARA